MKANKPIVISAVAVAISAGALAGFNAVETGPIAALKTGGASLLSALHARSPGERQAGAVTTKGKRVAQASPLPQARVLSERNSLPPPMRMGAGPVPVAAFGAPVLAAPVAPSPVPATALVPAAVAAAPLVAGAAGGPGAAVLLPLIPAAAAAAGGGGGGGGIAPLAPTPPTATPMQPPAATPPPTVTPAPPPAATPPSTSTPPLTPIPTPAPAVPEPATWLMMILGFGFLGGFLRRRRAKLLAGSKGQTLAHIRLAQMVGGASAA